jgi:hypothetical protein
MLGTAIIGAMLPLTHDENTRLLSLIDACSNRFGAFASQRGSRQLRAKLHRAVEKPSAGNWAAVKDIYIAWDGGRMTFGTAVRSFTGHPGPPGVPTRQQMFDALTAATR